MTKREKINLTRIIISIALLIPYIILEHLNVFDLIESEPLRFYSILSFSILLYLFISYDIIKKAFTNIIHGQIFDENFLMLVASIGAFIVSYYEEAIAVMIFYQIGELFEHIAVGKSRNSIKALLDIKPDIARVKRNNELIEIDPLDVSLGETLVVKPGERIPLDGILLSDSSLLDTKALTGESMPKDVFSGELLLSGSINLSNLIEIKVTKLYEDSTASKILELVENATNQKSRQENFITKFAKIYTPVVCASALLLFIIGSIITKDISTWGYRALNFLVVSCPCALVVSIPLSYFMGIGVASKYGILIKGSSYIEKYAKANHYVFDKTGTITEGSFIVKDILPKENKDEILYLASIAESNSNHPIAKSIINEYLKTNTLVDDTYELTDLPGYGIIAKKEDDTIMCGNQKLMEKYNIDVSIYDTSYYATCYVAKNNVLLGVILVEDKIKDEAYETFATLKNNNIKTTMLTGDNYNVSESVCNKLSITSFHSSLLPADKIKYLEEILKNKDSNVVFIGDGINDAPSLMLSDIGISMGMNGQDAAIEASDIVLMHDDLNKLNTLRKISKTVTLIAIENIVFSLIVKFTILILSSFGLTNMWISIFGDVGVLILAILNSLRVNKNYD